MIPKSFDINTAKEVIGDARMRMIEAKARADADAGLIDSPKRDEQGTYWDRIRNDMEYVVYVDMHHKKMQRIERMKVRES